MAYRNKMIELTESGSGSTTKANNRKKKNKLLSQQTLTNTSLPAQTTASASTSTATTKKNSYYNNTNYRWEETDTGGGYDKRQIVLRSPDQPVRTVIDIHQDKTPGMLPTQEELAKRIDAYNQWDAEMGAKIASSETQVAQLKQQRLEESGRLYGQNVMDDGRNDLSETLNMLHTEKDYLQRLKDERYYGGMEHAQMLAQDLHLRGGGTLWDAILRQDALDDQIALDRQKLDSIPAADPQQEVLEQEIQQNIDWVNYTKQVAWKYGINYNDLVAYAQRIEDEANMQKSVQFWTDVAQKDDRSMNAANWASVPMKVIGGVTGGISNALQSANNTLSGQYRPINQNTVWHYGTHAGNAIRNTTGDVVEDRLGGGIGGQIGRTVYEQTMELADAALGWGIKRFIVGSDLVSGNMKTFLEDMENAADLVYNSAELTQTYQDALDEGLTPEEAFGECMLQITTESLKSFSEKKFNESFLKGFDAEPYAAKPDENLSMVLYQSPEQDDFMTGFWGEDLQSSGKADFYVSPSGEVLPGEYESWIGENQRSTILSQIEDPTLKSVVGQMYPKNSVIGTGSLPELIRFSEENGLNLVRESRYMLAKTLSDYLTQATHSGMVSLSDKNVLDMIMTSWK